MLEHGPQGRRQEPGGSSPTAGLTSLVVLGDRWELLYVVASAFLLGIPMVHLHGGEITEGAIDERVRHAVTKLADLHCVASDDAARGCSRWASRRSGCRHRGTWARSPRRRRGRSTIASSSELLGIDVVSHPSPCSPTIRRRLFPGTRCGPWAGEALDRGRACATVVATTRAWMPGRDEVIAAHQAAAADTAPRDAPEPGP